MILSKKSSKWVFITVLLFAFFACISIATNKAYADSYSVPKVDINATVKSNASLHVVENRSFDFDGDFTCVWWTFDSLPQNSSLDINGVKICIGESGKWKKLKSVKFIDSWRDAGGPGGFAYSVDEDEQSVYVFFNASNTNMQVELDITYNNAVQIYEDTAELYWKYIGSGWEVDSENVNMTLNLPNPDSTSFELGDSVRAWGHGNLSGSLEASENNNIVYKTGTVDSGKYAEARVLFPKSWLSKASKTVLNAHRGEYRVNEVLKQEQQWADKANRERMIARISVYGFAGLCLIVIIACIFMYFRFGREYKPQFDGQYWRDDPYPNTNPAVIGRVWRMNKEDKNDFMTVIMSLCDKGIIELGVEKRQKERLLLGSKEEEVYYLDRVKSKSEEAQYKLDAISNGVLDLLFDEIAADGTSRVYLTEIKDYAQDNSHIFKNMMQSWQASVETETLKSGFFELASLKWQKRARVLSIIPLIISIILILLSASFIQFIFALLTMAICLFISRTVSKRSQLGADVNAKCIALRKWLKDFTALDERIPTDIKVWGKYMVYAHLFGVAEEVMHKLKNAIPDVFGTDAYTDVNDSSYVPWYWFWFARENSAYGGDTFGDMFNDSFTSAFDTAFSSDSSGDGSGGGFSVGGGGGFGGGGGGAR